MTTPLHGAIGAFLSRILGLPGVRRLFVPLLRVDYSIRRVNPDEDLDALTACAATLSSNRPEELRQDFRLEFADRDPQRWLFLIAEDAQGRILGFVRAMRQGPEQDWWIVGLGVRPLLRRRGIGQALVDAVLARLRAGGVSQVHLEVNRASRPAIALYRKLGFEEMPPTGAPAGARSGEQATNGDFLHMTLELCHEDASGCAGQSPPA